MKIYTRFAPSPTGHLHLGNLRTALFNALFAYKQKGAFLLRIEDTDAVRSTKDFAQGVETDLQWLGLAWDHYGREPVIFQSERKAIYEKYYQKLKEIGAAYPCFCTEARLQRLREQQKLSKKPPGYDGHCRHLSQAVIEQRQAQGETYHLRFRVPPKQEIIFKDLVKKEQCFKSEHLYDFVIQRSDKSPAFLYCNALDDALMGITHVLRGEDHLTNTAKQLLILEALDLKAPFYGHLPLISHQSGDTPLSKRDNSFSLQSLRLQGYLPGAILNYLARLGHTIASTQQMNLEELAHVFSIDHVHASAARFDEHQLNFWQKQAIRQQSSEAFWNSLTPTLKDKVPHASRALFIEVMQKMITLPQEAEYWIEPIFSETLIYSAESKAAIQQIDPQFWSQLLVILGNHTQTYQGVVLSDQLKHCLKHIADKKDHKLYWKALRAALTNTFSGPDIATLIQLVGITRATQRLQKAASLPLSKL